METRNPKLYRACGQHINASDDKCTDLAKHAFTMEEFENMKTRKDIDPQNCQKCGEPDTYCSSGCREAQHTPVNERSEHTQGPWKVILAPTQVVTDTKIIAALNGNGLESIEEKYANAHLIAAAPTLKAENEKLTALNSELLEACKVALRVVKNLAKTENTTVYKLLSNVIAKATGGK